MRNVGPERHFQRNFTDNAILRDTARGNISDRKYFLADRTERKSAPEARVTLAEVIQCASRRESIFFPSFFSLRPLFFIFFVYSSRTTDLSYLICLLARSPN